MPKTATPPHYEFGDLVVVRAPVQSFAAGERVVVTASRRGWYRIQDVSNPERQAWARRKDLDPPMAAFLSI
jgi:hypothetical protein